MASKSANILHWVRKCLYIIGAYWFCLNLPFQFDFPPTALGLMIFGLAWILRKDWWQLLRQLGQNLPFLFMSLLFIWVLIGTLYSIAPDSGSRELSLKIPLIAWPLAWAGMENRFSISTERLLKGFVIATLFSSLFLLGQSFYDYLETEDLSEFYYKELMIWEMVPIHYMSLYISFASALSLNWTLEEWAKKRNGLSFIWGLSCLILVVMIALAAIRIQWIVLPVLFIIVVFSKVRKHPKLLLPGISLIALGLIALLFSPPVQRRIEETFMEWQVMNNQLDGYQTNPRNFLWSHAVKVIDENPILGYGTGGGIEALNSSLESEKARFYNGVEMRPFNERRWNFHSEYLQHLGDHGIIGLLLLLIILLFPFYSFGKNISLYSVLFLVSCTISFLTESILERQAGLFFFAFFYAVLIVDRYRLRKLRLPES